MLFFSISIFFDYFLPFCTIPSQLIVSTEMSPIITTVISSPAYTHHTSKIFPAFEHISCFKSIWRLCQFFIIGNQMLFFGAKKMEKSCVFLQLKKMLKFPINIFSNLRGQHMLLNRLLSLATFTGFISEM